MRGRGCVSGGENCLALHPRACLSCSRALAVRLLALLVYTCTRKCEWFYQIVPECMADLKELMLLHCKVIIPPSLLYNRSTIIASLASCILSSSESPKMVYNWECTLPSLFVILLVLLHDCNSQHFFLLTTRLYCIQSV